MKNILLVIAACLVLAACETTPKGEVRAAAHYKAYVTVINNKPYVYPDPIIVRDKNVNIAWYLDRNARYQFTGDDGIVISGDPTGEFENCKGRGSSGELLDGGYTYRCKNKNDKHGAPEPRLYKYTIRLQPAGGGAPIDLDPMVVND